VASVGIIANPASGKDIRRLAAHGSVFDNLEKVNIVRRVLLGLQAVGVEEVAFMPDYFRIGGRAIDGLKGLSMKATFLEMPLRGNMEDSVEAAAILEERRVGCIVTLGGDGTNRAVAKGCGNIPIVPISTGTNNVFPYMIEGTIAGLAAGVVARGIVDIRQVTRRARRLEVYNDGRLLDIALVDVVVYDDVFVASRAIWDMSKVREIVLARTEPSNIGLSSIGGNLYCAKLDHRYGVYIRLGKGPLQVTAPIAPGLVDRLGITGYRLLAVGDWIEVTCKPSILALDGEREVEVGREMEVSIQLGKMGPLVVDIRKALQEAAKEDFFTRSGLARPGGAGCFLLESHLCLNPCDLNAGEGGLDGNQSGDA